MRLVMKNFRFLLWIFTLLIMLIQAHCYLELDFDLAVYGTENEQAVLKCNVNTDLDIKQVVWYKETLGSAAKTLYYYEPGSSIDSAYLFEDRVTRFNTSLSISPVYLEDEGWFLCRVSVWNAPTGNVTIDSANPQRIEEKTVRMKLVVYVRPQQVQLTTFAASSNMTLICKALGAKPAAEITWLKTRSTGESVEMVSDQSKVDNHDKLTDVTSYLYYMLSNSENAVKISCVVNQPDTVTTMYKNITMVSPFIQNAVKIYMEKLGSTVPYSVIGNQNDDDPDNPHGLVKISADPGLQVQMNSSVVLRASAPEVFPQPSFLWWKENELEVVYSGPEITIDNVVGDVTYNVLAQNQVGRIVLGVPLTVVGENHVGTSTIPPTSLGNEEVLNAGGLNGGLIAVIVIGSMLFCLFVALTVWYLTCKNPPNEGIPSKKTKKKSQRYDDEVDTFIPASKPLMRTTSTQTLEGKQRQKRLSQRAAASEDNLATNMPGRRDRMSSPPQYSTTERPMDKHLQEYDERASFVGDYGSALESNPSVENLHSAQEGDTQSEGSIPDSEDSVIIKMPARQEHRV